MSILLIAEHDNKTLSDGTLKAVSAAVEIGGDIHLLVAGYACDSVVEMASKVRHVNKVLKADDVLYKNFLAEPIAALIVTISEHYDMLIAPETTNGKNYMPRVAALLDIQQLSDITAVIARDTFERFIYAGNAKQTVKMLDDKKVLTVRTTAFAAVEQDGNALIENIEVASDPALSEYIGEDLTVSDRPELTSAKIIISGGRGMQSGDNFQMLERIADKLGAAVGASRAAVDAGYVPNDYQVGQTGKVVAPELYIAVGISGAIQHLAGMKDSKVIVAINKDGDAPIFQIADYGLVADLFTALPELEKELG